MHILPHLTSFQPYKVEGIIQKKKLRRREAQRHPSRKWWMQYSHPGSLALELSL